MKFEKPFLLSLVAPFMILFSTVGFTMSKSSKKIFYLPIGIMGLVIVVEKGISRRFRRNKILSKIKSFQETK